MEEEIFGPILPILTYRTFDEALGESLPIRGLWRPSSSAAINTRSTASPANCHSAGVRSTRSTSTCSW